LTAPFNHYFKEENMTSKHHDLWANLPEWENDHDAGQILDWWRGAAEVLAPLSKLADRSPNEALGTAVYSAENRVAEQVERWDKMVWTLIDENMGEGRLTPFGEVLSPLLERAGLTPQGLLVAAGRIEEPNAEEVLLRHMYGPATGIKGGYLVGYHEPLALTDMEALALSNALHADLLRGASRDPISEINGDLSRAIHRLERVPTERFANREERLRLQELIAQAGQIVASAEREEAAL